jgi:hypothetical protein
MSASPCKFSRSSSAARVDPSPLGARGSTADRARIPSITASWRHDTIHLTVADATHEGESHMKYTYTQAQNCILRDALVQASITHRFLMVQAIADGHAAVAGFYATLIIRAERAEHIVWGLSHHFPADSEVAA